MTAALALVPLDSNELDSADANLDRRIRFLRAALASERRPSRICLIRCELLDAEDAAHGHRSEDTAC